jgi:predicted glycosyltransferase
MKVLIDIAHPAHVHYFRNFARIFEESGHSCLFTLRNKGIILSLAEYYKLSYKIRSGEGNHYKLFYMIVSVINIWRFAKEFRPDIFVDMGTVFAAPVAFILRKPYIAFEDTEASWKTRLLHMPFTDVVITPNTFLKDLGKKHITFNSTMELMYLHPELRGEKIISEEEKISEDLDKNIILLRFVSWDAHHDKGEKGISPDEKVKLVNLLSGKYEVVISSEGDLPASLRRYANKSAPSLIHDLISKSKYVITEGATMASESVVLGTPVIYVNSIINGNTKNQAEKGLLLIANGSRNLQDTVNEVEKMYSNSALLLDFKTKCEIYLKSKINPTSFLIWFIEHWPDSFRIMKDNPEYQNRFK